jgi:glycosyltransferase involved in cell wall biosynthesis
MKRALSAAVVVCAASAEREALLRACVDSLLNGERAPDEILVVVDQNPALEASVASWLPCSARLLRSEESGISASRNAGLHSARSDIVAFVDDDAVAEPDWLLRLLQQFRDADEVLGVGGAVVPQWETSGRWLPEELLWVVGCTYLGHRDGAGPIRNPIGCNMAFRRPELAAVGGFSTSFGKRGAALNTCDETELGLRVERHYGRARIRSVPAARVRHYIPTARIGWRTLVVRCLSEGLSKARLRQAYGSSALGTERSYALGLITRRVPLLLMRGLVRRDRRSLLGAAAIMLSLVVTGASYAGGALLGRGRRACGGRRRSLGRLETSEQRADRLEVVQVLRRHLLRRDGQRELLFDEGQDVR